MVMAIPEIRLLQAAIALAEDLNFSRAAERLHITQPALSKQIYELESQLGFRLFERNHQMVELTDAGRMFVAEAREAVLHAERAVLEAKAAFSGADEILNIGKSAYTDPYLVSTLLSIQLPLFPGLRVKLWSDYSHELARQVIAGTLDLALITGIPDTPKLSSLKVADNSFYIAMSMHDPLALHKELQLNQMRDRNWVLFSRHVSPHMYELIQRKASEIGVSASDHHHVTSAEEAVQLILINEGLAFLNRTGAWRIAQHGITMRPLAEDGLRLITNLATRADSKSRLVSEFVKASARKLDSLRRPVQKQLPLTG
jgi:DNA-binding transcriptional LysR family regulator